MTITYEPYAWGIRRSQTIYNHTRESICAYSLILVRLFVCPDDHARVRSAWRFRFDTGAALGGGQVEFA